MKGLYLLDTENYDRIYGPAERDAIARLVDIYAAPQTRDSVAKHPQVLSEADVIFSGWGSPVLDAAFLSAAPRLKAYFYGAGSIRNVTTDAFWERKIFISSAWAANAVPVSEYALSQILFNLKHGWRYATEARTTKRYPIKREMPGCFGSIVGLISLGMIGRMVRERLRPFDLQVIAYDPFFTSEEAQFLDIEMFPLTEVFKRADVVSIHTPWLKETEKMITGELISSMKPGSSIINTSRGAVIDEPAMVDALRRRPDLTAILDVTWPEPPPDGSPLFDLPNVVITPHIAGSQSAECLRMGRYMVEECRRFLNGEPLRWAISRDQAARMA
jgi:phosphoglycerate dehydrogenase-like enzyme